MKIKHKCEKCSDSAKLFTDKSKLYAEESKWCADWGKWCADWGKWYADKCHCEEKHDRRIEQTVIKDYLVSTVFLGIDHSFDGGKPQLFETMIFPIGCSSEKYCERYGTLNEAKAGHKKAVKFVQEEME